MTKHSAPDYKTAIIARAREQGLQITALREQVLDIVLRQEGVIKAYTVLAQMQQQSNGVVAPPTASRALDFWAAHGVLHNVAAVNGYVLCRHARPHCGNTDEQTLSREWQALCAGVAAGGFKLKEEHVVLTGICKQCQK